MQNDGTVKKARGRPRKTPINSTPVTEPVSPEITVSEPVETPRRPYDARAHSKRGKISLKDTEIPVLDPARYIVTVCDDEDKEVSINNELKNI